MFTAPLHWCVSPRRPPGSPVVPVHLQVGATPTHTQQARLKEKVLLPISFCTAVSLHFPPGVSHFLSSLGLLGTCFSPSTLPHIAISQCLGIQSQRVCFSAAHHSTILKILNKTGEAACCKIPGFGPQYQLTKQASKIIKKRI